MKISKTAAASARRLFGLCQTGERLDEAKLRTVVARLAEAKPRDYPAILTALQRLTRLAYEQRQVTVESAVELDEASQQRVLAGLTKQYGPDLVAQYQINSSLLGGLRIRVGNDVFDGSVKGRLERFTNAL
ncbi:MAG: F0F1 ATP synthase subunit delta [Verrucomicrobia bacterium]|nr:MAG: F0F1 ATP synthase subunit delta [Verrucomicrobiota bacterium]